MWPSLWDPVAFLVWGPDPSLFGMMAWELVSNIYLLIDPNMTLTIYSWIGKYSSFNGSYGFLMVYVVKQSLNPIRENMKFR